MSLELLARASKYSVVIPGILPVCHMKYACTDSRTLRALVALSVDVVITMFIPLHIVCYIFVRLRTTNPCFARVVVRIECASLRCSYLGYS